MPGEIKDRSRRLQLEKLGNDLFDVLVLGGGISGVAAAHVLTRRGYRAALIDNHDFASGTSQESSQLIWGGIKYLENGHYKLVKDLCHDRNEIVRRFPRRVEPLGFLYPHFDHDPHSLMTLMMGAYLYWTLGKGFAERPRKYSTSQIMGIVPKMRPFGFTNGFQYFDARMVDSDARLTLDILFDAMDAGLTAANYLEFTSVNRRTGNDLYEIEAEDADLKKKVTIRAKWIVNTTGVWADSVNEKLGVDPPFRHLFSKGIHLVINKIETGGRALTCLSKDGRVFFVIPWGEVTLIGTTDTPFTDPPGRVISDQADIDYLRSECEAKFELTLGDSDILNTKAGLRPLLRPAKMKQEDFLALARSHKVWSDPKARVSCLWGGKYTSCFSMAEEIAATIHLQPSGTLIPEVPLATAALDPNLGMLSGELDEAALRAACLQELVVTTEDLLRRRTNIGLKIARKGQGKSDENRKFLEKLDGVLRKP